MWALVTEVDRMAIGPRTSEAADADTTVGPADVFDDDGLAKGPSHPLSKDPRDHVRTTSGRKRNNHGTIIVIGRAG